MGADPFSLALLATTAFSGYSAYKQSRKKPEATVMTPPTEMVDETDTGKKKTKKYPRGPAQLFNDEDLRLGVGGKLGM